MATVFHHAMPEPSPRAREPRGDARERIISPKAAGGLVLAAMSKRQRLDSFDSEPMSGSDDVSVRRTRRRAKSKRNLSDDEEDETSSPLLKSANGKKRIKKPVRKRNYRLVVNLQKVYHVTGLTYRTQVTFKTVEEQARAKLVRNELVGLSTAEFLPRTKEEVDKKFESMLLDAGLVPSVRVTKAMLLEQSRAEEASAALLALSGLVDFAKHNEDNEGSEG